MTHTFSFLLTFLLLWAGTGFSQELSATLLLKNRTVLEGSVHKRQVGTTVVQFQEKDSTSLRNLNLNEIDKIEFDLRAFRPTALKQAFNAGRYAKVIDQLKGRVIPYFAFVDQEANSNELVMLFIQSLYRTQNTAGVSAARKEVGKYAAEGEVRRLADMYHALIQLEQGETEAFDQSRSLFDITNPRDPLASMAWVALGRRALLENDWKTAYPYFSRVVTETPLDFEWSAEALYETARYHQANTNLVVAYQICQEALVMSSLPSWSEKLSAMQKELETEADTHGIQLIALGTPRGRSNEPGGGMEDGIDYRKRQQELEEMQP